MLAISQSFAADVMEHLTAYEGRWVGNFTIHSTASGFTESFPVEQRYWWEGEKLLGLAVMQRGSGMETATSVTYLEGDKLIAEIDRGKSKEVYYGVLHEDGLVWLPSDMKRAADHQMRERVVEVEDGQNKLLAEGFDTYVYSEGLAHIIYKGELTLQPKEAE